MPGRKLLLGGVAIPYERGLEGHSDGDAVLHAVIDAVLGAAGLGDIGEMYSDRDARWALRTVVGWYGHTPTGFQRFAGAFAADDRGDAAAADSLGAVANDPTEPAIVRASAIARLAAYPGAVALAAARRGARDASPLVRRGALDALEAFGAAERLEIAAPMLTDSTRIVRLRAAWVLAPIADSLGTPALRTAFARAAAELVASQRYNADRASSRLTLGAYYATRGQLDSAAAEFRVAVRFAPHDRRAQLALAAVLDARGQKGTRGRSEGRR